MVTVSGIKERLRKNAVRRLIRETEDANKVMTASLTKLGAEPHDDEGAAYFKALGIRPTDNKKAIREAYLRQMRKYHPDINKEAGAEAKAREINEAYTALTGAAVRYNVGEAGLITEKLLNNIKNNFIKAYQDRRHKDYDKLLTSAGYNRDNWSIVSGEIKEYANWRKAFDALEKKQFGPILDCDMEIKRLYGANSKMLQLEKDAGRLGELKLNIEKLEEMRVLSGAFARALASIAREVKDRLAEAEDENAALMKKNA